MYVRTYLNIVFMNVIMTNNTNSVKKTIFNTNRVLVRHVTFLKVSSNGLEKHKQ